MVHLIKIWPIIKQSNGTPPEPVIGKCARSAACVFWASWSCGPAGWLAMLLIIVGDFETNPGLTNRHKQVWICDICHKLIHLRKQIFIWCNRIEHEVQGVHLSFNGNSPVGWWDYQIQPPTIIAQYLPLLLYKL